jgi:hypothetical protein
MDKDLKSANESWHVKIKQNGMWGKKPAQVNFGPMKTNSTEAGKATQVSREVNRDLYWKNIHSVKSKESGMELIMNGVDTVEIHMLTVEEETTQKKNVVGTLVNADGEGNEMYHVSSWIDEMMIQSQNDSVLWHYLKLNEGPGSAYASLEITGDTTDQVLLFQVNNLEGKSMKEIMFSQPALGFVFQYKGKQVAAFQTMLKQTVWISKTLDPRWKTAILATTAALFGTIKAGNANGF